jgi:Holliday junction resolvase RusA-like endonuclease
MSTPVSTDAIEFAVLGIPVPQGSGRTFVVKGRAVRATTTAPLLAWRGAIATEARAAMAGLSLIEGPVSLEAEFRPAVRPASHWLPANARRLLRLLRLDAPVHHVNAPDLDKLCRAAMDALSAVVYVDDRQVARLVASKRWPAEGEGPGVTIRVARLGVFR